MAIADNFSGTNGSSLANRSATGFDGGFLWQTITGGGAGLTIQNDQLLSSNSTALTAMRANRTVDNIEQLAEIQTMGWSLLAKM